MTTALAWPCGKARGTTDEGISLVLWRPKDLSGVWDEAEAWHHVTELQSLKRDHLAIGEGTTSVPVETPTDWRCQDHETPDKDSKL